MRGGARGGAEDSNILAAGFIDQAIVEIRLARRALSSHRGELVGRHQARIVVFPQAPRIGIDDVLEVRCAVGERQELVDLLLVLGEDELSLAIIEQIGGFLVEHVAIEAEAHRADRMACDFGRDPLRPVVADDADDVAAAKAELDEAEREVAHPALVVVPGERPPQPKILFAQRDLAAMLLGVEAQQLRIGVGLRDACGIVHHAADSAGSGASSGSASTEAGSPSAILRPKSSTMTRWEISITTPMSCSIITTVMPNSSLRSTM